MKNKQTTKKIYVLFAVIALLLLTGCTPQEKTTLLPDSQMPESAEEEAASDGDFTVKRIYTYEYESSAMFSKSAYIKGCKEHEIHVVTTESLEDNTIPVLLQVDYRYGFYEPSFVPADPWEETLTESQKIFWNRFSSPKNQEDLLADTREDSLYYLERLLLSPDGTQMLVYACAESFDNLLIWLYDLESGYPFLLYDGSQDPYPIGAFSRDGRFMTFDIRGSVTLDRTIPVYDCQKELPTDDTSMEQRITLSLFSNMYPPDYSLRYPDEGTGQFISAELVNFQGMPGVITFTQDSASEIQVMEYKPVSSSYFESNYWLYGLTDEATLTIPYELDVEENRLYYLINFYQLWDIHLEEGTSIGPRDFTDAVVSFSRLEDGSLLALCTEDTSKYYLDTASTERLLLPNTQMPSILPPSDLYLYPKGETERQLLYKNLQNVIAIEYDAATRRILIETAEEESWTHRTCMILEF